MRFLFVNQKKSEKLLAKTYQKLKIIDITNFVLGYIGLLIACIEASIYYEYLINYESARDILECMSRHPVNTQNYCRLKYNDNQEPELNSILRGIVTFTTMFLVIGIFLRWKYFLKYKILKFEIPENITLKKSGFLRRVLIEGLICLVHTPPKLNYTFINKEVDGEIRIPLDSYISAFMMLRIFLLYRACQRFLMWNSSKAREIFNMYDTGDGSTLALKAQFSKNPFLSIGILVGFLAIYIGFAFKILEQYNTIEYLISRPYIILNGQDFKNIFNGMWCSLVMMASVGYGDYSPFTYGGRVIGFIGCILGQVLLALSVNRLAFVISFDQDQETLYFKIKSTSQNKDYVDSAAKFIQSSYKLHRALKTGSKEEKHLIDFINANKNFRYEKTEIKNYYLNSTPRFLSLRFNEKMTNHLRNIIKLNQELIHLSIYLSRIVIKQTEIGSMLDEVYITNTTVLKNIGEIAPPSFKTEVLNLISKLPTYVSCVQDKDEHVKDANDSIQLSNRQKQNFKKSVFEPSPEEVLRKKQLNLLRIFPNKSRSSFLVDLKSQDSNRSENSPTRARLSISEKIKVVKNQLNGSLENTTLMRRNSRIMQPNEEVLSQFSDKTEPNSPRRQSSGSVLSEVPSPLSAGKKNERKLNFLRRSSFETNLLRRESSVSKFGKGILNIQKFASDNAPEKNSSEESNTSPNSSRSSKSSSTGNQKSPIDLSPNLKISKISLPIIKKEFWITIPYRDDKNTNSDLINKKESNNIVLNDINVNQIVSPESKSKNLKENQHKVSKPTNKDLGKTFKNHKSAIVEKNSTALRVKKIPLSQSKSPARPFSANISQETSKIQKSEVRANIPQEASIIRKSRSSISSIEIEKNIPQVHEVPVLQRPNYNNFYDKIKSIQAKESKNSFRAMLDRCMIDKNEINSMIHKYLEKNTSLNPENLSYSSVRIKSRPFTASSKPRNKDKDEKHLNL